MDAETSAILKVPLDKEQEIKSVYETNQTTLFLTDLTVDIQEENLVKLSKDLRTVRIQKRISKR